MANDPHSHPAFLKFFGMYRIPVATKPFSSEKYILRGPTFLTLRLYLPVSDSPDEDLPSSLLSIDLSPSIKSKIFVENWGFRNDEDIAIHLFLRAYV
jgi:hypothetical protein